MTSGSHPSDAWTLQARDSQSLLPLMMTEPGTVDARNTIAGREGPEEYSIGWVGLRRHPSPRSSHWDTWPQAPIVHRDRAWTTPAQSPPPPVRQLAGQPFLDTRGTATRRNATMSGKQTQSTPHDPFDLEQSAHLLSAAGKAGALEGILVRGDGPWSPLYLPRLPVHTPKVPPARRWSC